MDAIRNTTNIHYEIDAHRRFHKSDLSARIFSSSEPGLLAPALSRA